MAPTRYSRQNVRGIDEWALLPVILKSYKGFDLVRQHGRVYAIDPTLGPIAINDSASALPAQSDEPGIIVADSIDDARRQIHRQIIARPPRARRRRYGPFAPLLRRLTGRPRLRVLFLDDGLPDPVLGGGMPRTLALVRAMLRAKAKVTLLPMDREPEEDDATRLLPGVEVLLGYGRSELARFLSAQRGCFDLIFVSRPHHMRILDAALDGEPEPGRIPIVYDAEALYATREDLKRAALGQDASPERLRRDIDEEIALARRASIAVTVDESSARAFRERGHSNVRVIGYAKQPVASPGFSARNGFLFVGPLRQIDTPNADSVVWFVQHVLPGIRRGSGRELAFTVAGETGTEEVMTQLLGKADWLGVLPDLAGVYASARVFVAPTRFAAGIPLKVYDAAAHGVPIVLTPLLAGQIGWRHEQEVLIAQTPAEFAQACLRLHDDQSLWERLRERALRRVARDCNPDRFDRLIDEVLVDAVK